MDGLWMDMSLHLDHIDFRRDKGSSAGGYIFVTKALIFIAGIP